MILGKRFINVRRALTEKNVMVADVEAGHAGIAKPPQRLETSNRRKNFPTPSDRSPGSNHADSFDLQ